MTEWSDWSRCDAECGSGEQTRSRDILKPAENEEGCPDLEERQTCEAGFDLTRSQIIEREWRRGDIMLLFKCRVNILFTLTILTCDIISSCYCS